MRVDSTKDTPTKTHLLDASAATQQSFVQSDCGSASSVLCAYTIHLPNNTRGVKVSAVSWHGAGGNGPDGFVHLTKIEENLRYSPTGLGNIVGVPLSMIIDASNGERVSVAGAAGSTNANNKALAALFFGSPSNGSSLYCWIKKGILLFQGCLPTLIHSIALYPGTMLRTKTSQSNLVGKLTHDETYFASHEDVGYEADRMVFLVSDGPGEVMSVVGFDVWVH